MTALRRARAALIATLLVPALALSGCGAGDGGNESKATADAEPSPDLPKGSVEVPEGVTLTKAGTVLKFRQPAVVAYEANTVRNSVLQLSVDSVQMGRIADFAAYQLDRRTRRSRPYYVRYSAKNVGTGDLSRAAVPLLAVDNRNTLIRPSTNFAPCPSLPLPAGFTGQKSARGCLVYLVPEAGTLDAMSFRPLQAFEPISWQGTILPAAAAKKAKAKKGEKKKGQS